MRTTTLTSAVLFGFFASFPAYSEDSIELEDMLPASVGILHEEPSVVEGVSMVELGDGRLIYLVDGQPYFFAGDLYDFSQGSFANLSEDYRQVQRARELADLDASGAVVFPATGALRETLWVFTDVTCGYCQVFHQQIADYNDLGLEVRYLAFPRFGMDSESSDLLETAWCSEDRQAALTQLKAGEDLPAVSCESPVGEHFELARRFGVEGTPAIFSNAGKRLRGYVPPDQILARLGIDTGAGQ